VSDFTALSDGEVFFGAVRGGALVVDVRRPDLAPRPVVLAIKRQADWETLERVWPEDFAVTEVGGAFEGRLTVPDAIALSPFERVEVREADGEPYAHGDGYFLRFLFGWTVGEYNRCFTRSKWRTPDGETPAFACRQMRRFYVEDRSRRNFLSVILAYRALELAHAVLLDEASEWLKDELAGDYAEAHDNRERDATHQRMSMGMALWMVELARGDTAGMVAALDQAIVFMDGLDEWKGLYALNGVRMMLMRAYVHQLAGEEAEALARAERAFNVYRRCVAVALPQAQTFWEMKSAHHAAWVALMILRHEEGFRAGRAQEDLRGDAPSARAGGDRASEAAVRGDGSRVGQGAEGEDGLSEAQSRAHSTVAAGAWTGSSVNGRTVEAASASGVLKVHSSPLTPSKALAWVSPGRTPSTAMLSMAHHQSLPALIISKLTTALWAPAGLARFRTTVSSVASAWAVAPDEVQRITSTGAAPS
jgi:hypothetical protein